MVHPNSREGNRELDEHLNESQSGKGEGFCRFCWEFTEGKIIQPSRLSGLNFRCGDCDKVTSPHYDSKNKTLEELRNDTFARLEDDADI